MKKDKEFLEAELAIGVSADNPRFVALGEKTCLTVLNACKKHKKEFSSVLDFGAGVGTYAEPFRKAGFEVVAQDIWKAHRDYIKEKFPKLKVVAKPVKADLMVFIEVAEHMTDNEIVEAVTKVSPKLILFSSTSKKTENDEEWGHINIKEQSEWEEFWELFDYKKIENLKKPTSWTMLLEKI